jgi:hypothetical protein
MMRSGTEGFSMGCEIRLEMIGSFCGEEQRKRGVVDF